MEFPVFSLRFDGGKFLDEWGHDAMDAHITCGKEIYNFWQVQITADDGFCFQSLDWIKNHDFQLLCARGLTNSCLKKKDVKN